MKKKGNTDKKIEIQRQIIIILLLITFAFFINRNIQIKGLYMDDLYLWSCYGEQSFLQYVFPIGGTRCRFLYYLVAYIEMAFTGTNVGLFVPVNIVMNGIIASALYLIGKKLSNSDLAGAASGFLYLLSSMSYYQIGQVWGLMEALALLLAILILYYLYEYLNDGTMEAAAYLIANALYFAVCFVHERYMVLLPLFFLVLVWKKNKNIRMWLHPVINILLIQCIRFFAIGSLKPAGTGGTEVMETLQIKQVIKFALNQVLYIFGINAGPEHLNGLPWEQTPPQIRTCVILSIIMIGIFAVSFLGLMIRNQKERKRYFGNILLFGGFIAGCIAASSVTIRVELRWVYVSYAAALLFLCYMFGELTRKRIEDSKEKTMLASRIKLKAPDMIKKYFPYGILVILYMCFIIPAQLKYRQNYDKVYFSTYQTRYNSLAEETFGKYGDQIFGKTIYVLGNTYQMSDFTAETFLKVFDKNRKAEDTKIVFIDSINDIGLITERMLVVREDTAVNKYQDITDYVRQEKCDVDFGYYKDNWMDEEAKMKIMAGSSGIIDMKFMYPGGLTGNEKVKVWVNGDLEVETQLKENVMTAQIYVTPYSTVDLFFENNFHMQDAKEQRGEKKLAMLVELNAD